MPQATLTTLEQETLLKRYILWKKNLQDFVKMFFVNDLTAKIPVFHSEIYKLLPKSKRLVIAAPRGFGKSKICSKFFPLHQGVFEQKKDILIISASENLAIEWLRQIRMEIDNNEDLNLLFPDLRSSKWTENHIILNNKTKVNIRAKGAGGQIRGFRPDLVVLDDIETDESVLSEDQRRKLRDWIFKACLNTLMPHGQFIMIGTIIHPLALLNDILENDNGWEKRVYQAYIGGKPEKGKELWPSLWTHEKLQVRKAEIGSFAFSSEFLNNPILDETAPIKPHQIRYWEELPQQYTTVIAVDPAYSDDEHADYKVAVVVCIDALRNRYLLTYVRSHMPLGEFQDACINLFIQFKSSTIALGVPSSGVEKGFLHSFTQKCQDRKIYPPIIELKNVYVNTQTQVSKRNKTARVIAALQPLFENGKYYIHHNHGEVREELFGIGHSRHDDLVDAMTYAEQLLPNTYVDVKEEKHGRYGEPIKEELAITGKNNYGW